MAAYVFETITQEQAAGFAAADILVFTSGSTASAVTVTQNTGSVTTAAATTLTLGAKTIAFPTTALTTASQAGNIQLGDNSRLVIGGSGNDGALTIAPTGATPAENPALTIYGFAGADVITGNGGADFLNGGVGADNINGGVGNDHIYGNSLTNTDQTNDGDDVLNGGAGGDYIQGNQGNDTINGGTGSDRIFGGQGDDVLNGGDTTGSGSSIDLGGQDTINGNLGNDTINGGSEDDFLRGGKGDDSVLGGANNDQIFGDLGSDTIIGGTGVDILTGGDGNDTFIFGTVTTTAGPNPTTSATADSLFTYQGGTAIAGSPLNVTDQITDLNLTDDKLSIHATNGTAYTTVLSDAGVSFSSVEAARTYAQGLLADTGVNHNTTLAAVQVGSDTYLFFDGDNNNTVESAIRLNGINATDVTNTLLVA